MPSLPLELHQVLEEEYASMYGPLPRPPVGYDEKQIVDQRWARVILWECGIEVGADNKEIARRLNEFVDGGADLSKLKRSPAR